MKKTIVVLALLAMLVALVGVISVAAQDNCPDGMICYPGSDSGGVDVGECPDGMICYPGSDSDTVSDTDFTFSYRILRR